jgi:serine/threonine protein kinase
VRIEGFRAAARVLRRRASGVGESIDAPCGEIGVQRPMTATVRPPIAAVRHYNLLEQLEPCGPGSCSARDTWRGRTVAVRLLPRSSWPMAWPVSISLQRAHSMRSVSHPNVTTIFDAGEHEGRIFMVFEYPRGQSLRAEITGRRSTIRRALDVGIRIADGLADARRGIHSPGLSPETVAADLKGRVKIPSFDLATCAGFEHVAEGMRYVTMPRRKRPVVGRLTNGPTSTLWARSSTKCLPRSPRSTRKASRPAP